MYKTRFRKWGLSKHLSEEAVVAIMRVAQQRAAAGKLGTHFVRQGDGSVLDMTAVQRYLRRNPSVWTRVYHERQPESLDEFRIACRTPLSYSTTCLALQLPEFIQSNGIMFTAMKVFIDAYLTTESLREADISFREKQNRVIESFRLVSSCIRLGADARVLRILNRALGELGGILANSGPVFVIRTLHEVRLMMQWVGDKVALADSIARHLAHLSEKVLGSQHPQSVVWAFVHQNLRLLTSWEFTERLGSIALDFYRPLLKRGQLDPAFARDLLRVPGNTQGTVKENEAHVTREKRILVPQESRSLTPFHIEVLSMYSAWMASLYLQHGELTKCMDTISQGHATLARAKRESEFVPYCEARLASLTAEVEEARGNPLAAVEHYRKAVFIHVGARDVRRTQEALFSLERVFCRMGDLEKVNEVREERIASLDRLIQECEPM